MTLGEKNLQIEENRGQEIKMLGEIDDVTYVWPPIYYAMDIFKLDS